MSAIQEQEFHSEKINWGTWKKLWSYTKPYQRHLKLLLFTMTLCGLCDVAMPYMTSLAIDQYITPGKTEGLGWFAVGYFMLVTLLAVCVYSFCHHAGKVQTHMCHDIRKAGFDRLQELSFSYYDVMSVGYLLSRLTNDVSRLADVIAWSLVDL